MVSFLGDYRYSFPKPRQLTARLSDLLETNVDDSYFLSEQAVASYVEYAQRNAERGNGFAFEPFERLQAVNVERERERQVAHGLTTKPQSRATGNFILEPSTPMKDVQEQSKRNTSKMDVPTSADKTASEPRAYGCVLGTSEAFTKMPLAETARTVRASRGGR